MVGPPTLKLRWIKQLAVGGWPTYAKASVDKTVGGWRSQKLHKALRLTPYAFIELIDQCTQILRHFSLQSKVLSMHIGE
jgi:hypothetical protein